MKSNAQICVPVCVQRASDLRETIIRASEAGDLIELRLDCLAGDERNAVLRELSSMMDASRTLILTMRPKAEGGMTDISFEERTRFWSSPERFPPGAMIDVELDLVSESGIRSFDPSRIILSHHQFDGVSVNLDEMYERMAATPAAVLKIAVPADDAVDCLPIFKILERSQRDGRAMIAIGMGQAGVVTRIVGPSRGSFLTYGSLDDESATAPGQLTARELREVYRIDHIDRQTEITGLIGQPVGHSISPHIHNAAFAAFDINAAFIPFEVRDLEAFIRRMVRESSREIDWNVRGFSVTAPHKEAVMKHLDWIEPAAKEIGAVNTIVMQDSALHGYNTDAAAFIAPLKEHFASFRNLRCAVIGAGGAARGVVWALRREAASVSLFARNAGKGKRLAEEFDVHAHDLAEADFKGFDVVINATPLGTRGKHETATPAKTAQLRGVRLAYDLVYNPLETLFMREARAAGAQTLGGLEMLIAQAVEQFKLWTGRNPDVMAMRAAAGLALSTK